MCRVHELEAEKMALQSERLIKQHELRRRDLVILRYDRQRHICEEIITRQRQLMEGKLPIRCYQSADWVIIAINKNQRGMHHRKEYIKNMSTPLQYSFKLLSVAVK
jgi:hypothetical protein